MIKTETDLQHLSYDLGQLEQQQTDAGLSRHFLEHVTVTFYILNRKLKFLRTPFKTMK